MAKLASKNVDITINSVALEGYVRSGNLNVSQQTPEVTALSDAGPRRVVDNYDYDLSIDGPADFASGASDATIFGLVGSTGVALDLEPTGATAGANDPNYTATSIVLTSYGFSWGVGEDIKYTAAFAGNAALSRDVA